MKRTVFAGILSVAASILLIVWLSPAKVLGASTEVEQLRDSVDKLQKKVDELEKGQAQVHEQGDKASEEKKKGILPITPYYKDGFFLETADEQFRLNITGVVQMDTRLFDAGSASPNSFDIRRARIDLRGWAYKNNVFRLQLEMADTPYLRNAYWLFKKWPELQLQLGQFKIPVGGAEFLTEEAQVNFVEYSVDTPISPFFDRGFMLWGLPLDGIVQYAAGIFNGVGTDFDVNSGDLDNTKDFAGRLLFVPFKKTNIELLQGFHIGGGYEYGLESIKTARGETRDRTENFSSLWFDWKLSTMDLQKRTRWGAEAHYLVGPFTASYEYNIVEWHDITAYDDKGAIKYELPGTYHVAVHEVWASFFLTGEKKEFQDIFFCWRQPKPKNNFSLKNGTWGAWEILLRGAIRESSSALFGKGVIDGSIRGHSITGGINWIANPKVRIMFNVNYLKNDEGKGIITKGVSKGKVDNVTKYVPDELGFLLRFVLTI